MPDDHSKPVSLSAELTVEAYLSGVRIDSFLVKHFRNFTPFRMQRIVKAGNVYRDGVPVEPQQRVYAGQRISIRLTEPPDKLIDPEPLPIEILYEDPWLVVVNKPAGQVTHPVGKFQSGTLCNAVQFHLNQQTCLPGLLRPSFVHRLDRQTSGILIVAKEHLSHRRLSIQFQQREVRKEYLALVEGHPAEDTGVIDAPLGQLGKLSGILMSADADAKNPKSARTDYDVLQRFDDCTLLRVMPQTGRMHQIRVHLASIGHPVLGDEFYGPYGEIRQPTRSLWNHAEVSTRPSPTLGTTVIRDNPHQRHALHAHHIAFLHPITRQRLQFKSALPADMQEMIRIGVETRL
ncbi:MAG: RluA family pseudouridine synthase [Planctomycetes bacterium]|nr:RluA family pseudouridine synthase [Planctomycetota bacterium]